MTPAVPTHAIHLRLVQRVRVDTEKACPFFSGDTADWLGTREPAPDPAVRRYLTDLSMPVHERVPRVVFRKAAFVDLGQVRPRADGCEVEISWRSSSLAPLFPVFAGHLIVTRTEIRLEGYYAPPGGELGVALDRVFLNIAARGTGRWFLERVVEAVALPDAVATTPIVDETDDPDAVHAPLAAARPVGAAIAASAVEPAAADPALDSVESVERVNLEDLPA